MTLDQLQQFFALSQCKNFTQASRQLYITQPALSKSISALEKELQLKLVNRDTRTVALTAAGEEFAQTCQQILATYRDGLNKAQSTAGEISGKLLFGLPSERFDFAAMGMLSLLRANYPGIRAELKFYPANGLLRALDNGNVDFIFAADWPRSKNLNYRLLETSRNCAVLPSCHSMAAREALSYSELKGQEFIAIDYMVSGREFDNIVELARADSVSPHVVYEAHTIPELLMQVACGRGITILSEKYRPMGEGFVVFVPLTEHSYMQEYLIWKKHSNPCVQAVADTAEAYAENRADSFA